MTHEPKDPRLDSTSPKVEDLLGFENPERERYVALIREAADRTSQSDQLPMTNFSDYYSENLVDKAIEQELVGRHILDLGGTALSTRGEINDVQAFAKKVGAKSYIPVNPFFEPYYRSQKLLGRSKNHPDERKFRQQLEERYLQIDQQPVLKDGELVCIPIQTDLLNMISQMQPRNDMMITINGIDKYVIGRNPPYHQAVAQEINRVLQSGSLIIGCNSDALGYINEDPNFVRVIPSHNDPYNHLSGIYGYRKK